MKVLVTGSAGFIGFHLAERLLARGDEVVGIDNLNDNYDPGIKLDRLEAAGIAPGAAQQTEPVTSTIHPLYTFRRLDITDRDKMRSLFTREGFDAVSHLAAQPCVRRSLEEPQ